jgi:mannosyl-3-phosphoglycerate phosphatase family protein
MSEPFVKGNQPALMVVTDLDGCLLDERTYSHGPALEALEALQAANVPVVLCSSKTRREMERLSVALALGAPFIVENGGAVLVPDGFLRRPPEGLERDGGYWLARLGKPRALLVCALQELARETGVQLRGFSELSPAQVQSLTGLDKGSASLALDREYDEPFTFDGSPDSAALLRSAAAARGLRITMGGRFAHLTGDTDKGRALVRLVALCERDGRRFSTVGLGDSDNDLEMLRAVDRPIIVPRPGRVLNPTLTGALPGAERAPLPGPHGWNAAVLAVLHGRNVPATRQGAGNDK